MKALLALALLLVFTSSIHATDYGIFVNGAYGKGATRMNNLVTERIDGAKAAFDKRAGSSSWGATTKALLCSALESITCGPGDTLTIAFMGHGNKNKLVFAKESTSSKKFITADELKNKITARITDCTCKVRLVIFACHSGSIIDNLFMDEHIVAVYTSCRSNQQSFSDAVFKKNGFEDRGDWMKEFVRKWNNANPAADLGATLENANDCALTEAPAEFSKRQTPTGWRRGTFTCKAHVESEQFTSSSRSVEVTFYDPSHLRGQKMTVRTDAAGRPPPGTTFRRCDWITFDATFGDPPPRNRAGRPLQPRNGPTIVSMPVATPAPQEEYLAHVKVRQGGRVVVQLIKPYWLGCKERQLAAPSVADNVTRCQFVSGTATITDPKRGLTSTTGLTRSEYCPEVIIKVSDEEKEKRIFYGHIVRPLSLKWLTAKEPICVRLRRDQNSVLPTVARGQFIRVSLKSGIVGRQIIRGRNARRVASSEAELVTFDLGLDGMDDPADEVPDSEPFIPIVEVGNFGSTAYPGGASLDLAIVNSVSTPVHNDSVPVPAIDTERATLVAGSAWQPTTPGSYVLTASINLGSSPDDNLQNNTVSYPFEVVSTPPEENWQAQFIDVPLPMAFDAVERVVLAPGVGSGIATSADQLGLVFQELEGDFFVAGLGNFASLAPAAGLGFMARSDLIPQAAMASWVVQGNGQAYFDLRPNDGGSANNHFTGALPAGHDWIGFGRSGDFFSVYASTDGDSWSEIAQQFALLPPTLLVGIASYSGQDQFSPPSQVPLAGIYGFPTGLSDIPLLDEINATALSTTAIAIDWPDVVATELGYNIYRSTDGLSFSLAGSTGPDGTNLVDGGLSPATTYLYEVRPVTAEGEHTLPCLGVAETQGEGLAAWAAANGIADPFAAPAHEAEPRVFNYATGAPASDILYNGDLLQMGRLPGYPSQVVTLTKGPGIHDYKMDLQFLDEFSGLWTTHFTLEGSDPAGTYVFDAYPVQSGAGLERVVVRPVSP